MGVIFNISEAIKSSEFNVLGLSIPMLLENEIEEFEKGSKISKLFVNKTLTGYSESYHTSVSHGGFRPAEDMEIAKLHDWEDGYGKTFVAQTWKDSFAISQEAREDNKDLEINRKVKEFGTNYARTREQYCAATAAGALAKAFTYGGKKFTANAIDTVDGELDGAKQTYFHRYHYTPIKAANEQDFIEMNGYGPWVNAGSADQVYPGNAITAGKYATEPQSNKFLITGAGGTKGDIKGLNLVKINPAQGDTAANIAVYDQIRFVLDKIKEYGRLHKNYDGKLVPIEYNRIIVPSNSMFNKAIIAALGSSLVASESFTGPMRADQYELVEWPYLNGQPGFGPKELGMIVVASDRNQRELGFTLWDRIPLTVKSYLTDGNDVMWWSGRARFKTDTCDPYSAVYVAMGGLRDLSGPAFSGTTTKFIATTSGLITTSNATFIDLVDFSMENNPYATVDDVVTVTTTGSTDTTVTGVPATAIKGQTYTATVAADTGKVLPDTIEVKVSTTTLTVNSHYTYNKTTGKIVIFGNVITGAINIKVISATVQP